MEKRKNSNQPDNNQLILIGIVLVVLLGGASILGGLLELVFGIIGGVIGLVFGIVGTVIGLVFGLIGTVIGLVFGLLGAVIAIVASTAVIWVPILLAVFILKSFFGNHPTEKKKNISVS